MWQRSTSARNATSMAWTSRKRAGCTRTNGQASRIGDQADRRFWKRFKQEHPRIDVLIDDGGHEPEQQLVTLEEMLPHLRPGGVYICEDVHGERNRFNAYVHGVARKPQYLSSQARRPEQGDCMQPDGLPGRHPFGSHVPVPDRARETRPSSGRILVSKAWDGVATIPVGCIFRTPAARPLMLLRGWGSSPVIPWPV